MEDAFAFAKASAHAQRGGTLAWLIVEEVQGRGDHAHIDMEKIGAPYMEQDMLPGVQVASAPPSPRQWPTLAKPTLASSLTDFGQQWA